MNSLENSLTHLRNQWDLLTHPSLPGVVKDFSDQMKSGLSGHPRSLAMIPAFIRQNARIAPGNYVGLDLSGSNFRVVLARVGAQQTVEGEPVVEVFRIPAELKRASDGSGLFNFIAEGIEKTLKLHRLGGDPEGIGFTFAFPTHMTAVDRGTLVKWTKEWNIPPLVGADVAEALRVSLRARGLGSLRVKALVNDTVGTLAVGTFTDHATTVGGILGTGVNIAAWIGGEAVNLESGNYDFGAYRGSIVTPFDETLDRESDNRGHQYLEKMVGGKYLGELSRLLIVDLAKQGAFGRISAEIAEKFAAAGCSYPLECSSMTALLRDEVNVSGVIALLKLFGIHSGAEETAERFRFIARLVIYRAAQVAGLMIGGAFLHIDPKLSREHVVAIDGSVYENAVGYDAVLRKMLVKVLGEGAGKIRVKLTKDGSGIGAALVAAMAGER